MTNRDLSLNSQDAVDYVMKELGYTSYYSIAKDLSKDSDIKVQPIQISNYHKGKRSMGEKVASHFYDFFGIKVIDAYHAQGRPFEW